MSSSLQNIFTSFSQALRYVLEKKRFSQTELAEKLNKGDSQISRWLSGEVTPYPRTQKKIASVLQVEFQKEGDNYTVIDLARSQLEQARESVTQIEDSIASYKASGLREDDPQKLLELAESLIRTARELMKKN